MNYLTRTNWATESLFLCPFDSHRLSAGLNKIEWNYVLFVNHPPDIVALTIEGVIRGLSDSVEAIACYTRNIPEAEARYKPESEDWSVLEIVNHLYDEEQYDFRVRLRYILESQEGDPPPIDPDGWAVERRYNERDLGDSLANFQRERAASLDWLRLLSSSGSEPDLSKAYKHPSGFTLRAGDILYSWLAHDILHLRQLVEVQLSFLRANIGDYSTEYAG